VNFSQQRDSLLLNWQMKQNMNIFGGGYVMGMKSLDSATRLCFLQPEYGKHICLADDETAFILSRSALKHLKDSASFVYGNTRYVLVDTLAYSPDVLSLHVKDMVEGGEMWIVDNSRLPLIWQMRNNPLGINWKVENVVRAFDGDRNKLRIAFISDAHVQDVVHYPSLVRTMDSEIHSTRLFNENYFALKAALDDVSRRNITLVVLPGDLTDNGQRVNILAVKSMLNDYTRRCGMLFFVTTGNHDPARPFGDDCVSNDFLASDGSNITITSSPSLLGSMDEKANVDTMLHCCGYKEILQAYCDFGFYPRPDYLYWSTPFSKYTYDDYSYAKATKQSASSFREYQLCDTLKAIDASYVVEPVKGVWLLAIDGDVYLPGKMINGIQTYLGTSVGYNNTLKYKKFLLGWIKNVAIEARKRGKTLVTFCHYPAADANSGATPLVSKWWGNDKFNIPRMPSVEFSQVLEKAGIRLHFAGHLHVNNTAVVTGNDGQRMYNIQVPSTALCVPAYKILTIEGNDKYKVQTVVLDSVSGFDSIRPYYIKEYLHNHKMGSEKWNPDILYSADYVTFCDMHFRNLLEARLIPDELPAIVKDSIMDMSSRQLMEFASGYSSDNEETGQLSWTGRDLITDLYRLRYAGSLALRYIPSLRLSQYHTMFDALLCNTALQSQIVVCLRQICQLFQCYEHSLVSDDFVIDLSKK
jgi:Predicted phosphohydrolases